MTRKKETKKTEEETTKNGNDDTAKGDIQQIKIILDALSLKEFKFKLSTNDILRYAFRASLVFMSLVYFLPNQILLIFLTLIMLLLMFLYFLLNKDSVCEKTFDQAKIDKLLEENESKSETTIDDNVTGQ